MDCLQPKRLGSLLPRAIRRRARWLAWTVFGAPTPRAEAAFEWLFGPQTSDWVPANVGGDRGCAATTADAIQVALLYGMHRRAERWTDWLASQSDDAARQCAREEQRSRSRRLGFFTARRRSARALIDYLTAVEMQVRAAFAAQVSRLPERIAADDGRVRFLLEWLGSLPETALIADVGCGKGRFLRQIAARLPAARLVGIDLSAVVLAHVPATVETREGSLLRIPATDAEFDAALAVESLEHALVPGRAVEELCRVVKPGGQILIIDKHRARQPLSEHEPWERWFWPRELTGWLDRWCDQTGVQQVAHSEGIPGQSLFLAAWGTRSQMPIVAQA